MTCRKKAMLKMLAYACIYMPDVISVSQRAVMALFFSASSAINIEIYTLLLTNNHPTIALCENNK